MNIDVQTVYSFGGNAVELGDFVEVTFHNGGVICGWLSKVDVAGTPGFRAAELVITVWRNNKSEGEKLRDIQLDFNDMREMKSIRRIASVNN
jgi:hypothetical protein